MLQYKKDHFKEWRIGKRIPFMKGIMHPGAKGKHSHSINLRKDAACTSCPEQGQLCCSVSMGGKGCCPGSSFALSEEATTRSNTNGDQPQHSEGNKTRTVTTNSISELVSNRNSTLFDSLLLEVGPKHYFKCNPLFSPDHLHNCEFWELRYMFKSESADLHPLLWFGFRERTQTRRASFKVPAEICLRCTRSGFTRFSSFEPVIL